MFTKDNLQSTRGLQPSKWDEHYESFVLPGDRLKAPLDQMSGQTASQFAARMNVIEQRKGGKRRFHSGVDKIEGIAFVRVRPEGELEEPCLKGEEGKKADNDLENCLREEQRELL